MPTPLRVLIVEDRPADAELMVHELEQAGFKPEWQRVEIEADYLAQLRTVPDIILADHTLPQFGAQLALELLKKSGLDIPLIVVTGSISEEVAVERIKQGAADYILKDRTARLGPAVKRALEEKKLQEEKRQAEAGLRASEARKGAILESALDCIITMDHHGRIIEFNPAAEKTFGYNRDEVMGKVMAELIIPPPLRERHRRGLAHYLATGEGPVLGKRIELTAIRADATEFPVELSILRIPGSEPPMFTGFIRDITQRKRAEQEIQSNLERIRALHDIDVAITSSLDLRYRLNVLLEKINLFLPYSTVTVRLFNKKSNLLEPVACRNLDEKEWKAEEWKAGRGSANIVFETRAPLMIRNCYADPRIKDPAFYRKHTLVSYLGVPLLAKDEILGVLSFYTKEEHEFTNEEIELLTTLAGQAAIAIHNAQLYEQTRNQAEELKQKAEELETANKVKDEFLSVMSHELRTPLNVVVGYAGMMKDGMLGEVNPQQEEALGKMISRANDQLMIVNNILYATVLEAEKINVDIHEFVLGDFLNQLKPSYDLPTRKEPVIRWECADLLAPVRTDSAKLKLILQNLIDNALKFTKSGEVKISAQIVEYSRQKAEDSRQTGANLPTADRLLPTGRQWVEFKVADTGVGIPKDHLPSIFDKFRQVDSSETRSFGGVGMGLYIVKQFTGLLGGTVQVESEPDKGTVFTVRIPVEN